METNEMHFTRISSFGALLMLVLSSSAQAKMTMSSPTLSDGEEMPLIHVADGFGCSGQGAAPSIEWQGAPIGTKSFILLVFDPDAPTDSGWWHWAAYDIPAEVTSFGLGSDEVGVQARNDFGFSGYGGACPPPGNEPHRYRFSVFAMPMESIGIGNDASPAMISFFANNMSLDSAAIEVTYGRN